MTPREVIDFYGTQKHAAAAIGISQASVSEWVSNGYVPLGRQYELQVLTGGRLKADPESIRSAKEAA